MLINTRETFYSADSEETDERCADSVFLQGSVAASSSPRLSLNLGHFRPPPSAASQSVCVALFCMAAFTVMCGGRWGAFADWHRRAHGGERSDIVQRKLNGDLCITCEGNRKRGSRLHTMKCFLLWVGERAAASPIAFQKKYWPRGFILCIWFGFWCRTLESLSVYFKDVKVHECLLMLSFSLWLIGSCCWENICEGFLCQ